MKLSMWLNAALQAAADIIAQKEQTQSETNVQPFRFADENNRSNRKVNEFLLSRKSLFSLQ